MEASGSAAAITLGLRILRPRGLFICVGQGAQTTLPVSQIATQKIELRGAFELAADNSRSMKLQLSF